MKKHTIIFFILISTLFCFSQTTVEEWNFVTKGYKIQKESGLDMKKGYELVNCSYSSFESLNIKREFYFKNLIRISDKKTTAILVEYVRTDRKGKMIYYFCIPSKNSKPEIWQMVESDIRAFNQDLSIAYNWALMQYISNNKL